MHICGISRWCEGLQVTLYSTDRLIIERSVQYKENPLHASLEPHAETSIPFPAPDISDDESTHSDHGSDLSSKYDQEEYEHVDVEPPQMPKWEHTTLQETRDLVGIHHIQGG